MKKYLTTLLFLFWSAQILQAQTASGTILIYGKVSRNTTPVQNIKILLVEASYTGIKFDKTICDSKKYPSQVKVFSTDTKGEYNFKGVKRGIKYKLIICDSYKSKVYFIELKTPSSGNNILRVPEQKIQ
jgi:hypothetical protein